MSVSTEDAGALPDTDPELRDIVAALAAREPIFHRPEFGTTRADFAAMIADDYWQVGASGHCYDRSFVLDTLERRHAEAHEDAWEADDVRCRALGGETYLFTYRLRQGTRTSRRMTLWQRRENAWRALYHQGTLLQEDAPA